MYKLYNKEFKTKEILKSYLIETLDFLNDCTLHSGDDFEIIKEGIQHIPCYSEKAGDITKIMGGEITTKGNVTIWKIHFNVNRLKYKAKYKREDVWFTIYLNEIVRHVPPVKESTIEYVFKFGKYKGVNIKDVEEQYLRWISGPSSNLNPVEKKMITQYLKYGFIPFNPKHYSK